MFLGVEIIPAAAYNLNKDCAQYDGAQSYCSGITRGSRQMKTLSCTEIPEKKKDGAIVSPVRRKWDPPGNKRLRVTGMPPVAGGIRTCAYQKQRKILGWNIHKQRADLTVSS